MLSIGTLHIDPPLVLAPLAGISDLPYRLINRSFGCRMAFTEMISANSLAHKSKNTLKMLSTDESDSPLGIQLLGNNPDNIKIALDVISEYRFDLIDFNAACPVTKVVAKGEGAGLCKDPARLQKLLKMIVEHSRKPVTVKIRSGWDNASINATEVALRAEDAGVHGLIIHGRTKMQGYKGGVDYSIIKKVKESISIPVIASGDALSPFLIRKLFDETGCNGVAIARGGLGNPWLFRETADYLKNQTLPLRPNIFEVTRIMRKHLYLVTQFYGERNGIKLFRKFFGWYTKGMAVKELKTKAFSTSASEKMFELIDALESLPTPAKLYSESGFPVLSS